MKFSLKEFVRVVPANGQTDIDVHGDKLLAVDIPDSGFTVSFDNGEEVFVKSGIQYGSSGWLLNMVGRAFPKVAEVLGGFTYNKVSIFNHTNAAETVRLLAGFGDVDDKSAQVVGTVETADVPLVPYRYGLFESSEASNASPFGSFGYSTKGAILSEDSIRRYAIIENVGSDIVYVSGGSRGTVVASGFESPLFDYCFQRGAANDTLVSNSSYPTAATEEFCLYYQTHGIRLLPNEKIGLSGSSSYVFNGIKSDVKLGYILFK
ncbi:MAG: hypothetical protein BHW65_04485 [Verrucomicrobia bacterium CAG:312_58_20]|nr:MAG: hypothetical protein BHW65_04485 [Verrucomicrobia bacterium CAG:312_58_20]